MPILTHLGVSSPFDSQNSYITSPLFSPSSSSKPLAILRTILALFSLTTSLFVLAYQASHSTNPTNTFLYYSYFTSLSFIGLTSYFVASAFHTSVYAWKGVYLLRKWPKVLQLMHTVLFSTIATFPIVVTIVFWALLASPETFETPFSSFSSIAQHACNAPLALFEIILTNAPPLPWLHLPICILLLGFYLCIAYITRQTQGIYVYNFLDPTKQHAFLAAYIIGIAIGECIVFALVRGLMVLRVRFVQRRLIRQQMRYNLSRGGGGGEGGGRGVRDGGEEEEEEEKKVDVVEKESLNDGWEEVERPSGSATRLADDKV